ncbi:uncharacterized protein LOC131939536 isoform X1 [Physella acuta]|nr:uncharacterized protein LOC131939536 isoform X1 [Physella acuta]XP_059153895.1 uncharacterized protein LOC131939536 isoform X1 [Physella acuta]
MLSQQNREELETRGVTVVADVIPHSDCDQYQKLFRKWTKGFGMHAWPQTKNSLIQRYRSGHLQPAWEVRLAAKPVFAQLWQTDKLLSSLDAIAIGRPPEQGEETFWSPADNWVHVDQTSDRLGLHAYQGAVYLEECAEDDWTFEVLEGSHKYFDEFMDKNQVLRLKPHHLEWFAEKNCPRRRIPCPKGGMVLWDSRLFHANARPIQGRPNPRRWRYVVFVCMAPASWATPSDLQLKRKAYEELKLTTHWPSQGVAIFSTRINKNEVEDPNLLPELPEVARSDEAKRLVGILPYPDDGKDEPDFRPKWDKTKGLDEETFNEAGMRKKPPYKA